MIVLPSYPSPNGATPSLVDFGALLRPPLGGPIQKINRLGSRFRVMLSFPPMLSASDGRLFVARLVRAKFEGVRVPYPLLSVDQGGAGSPVVNGGGNAGTSLAVRGLIPGYVIKEGFWLSVQDASGRHYLHNVAANVTASGGGLATVTISPSLRHAFADGAIVHLETPMIEGIIDGEEQSWSLSIEHHIGIEFSIEEVA